MRPVARLEKWVLKLLDVPALCQPKCKTLAEGVQARILCARGQFHDDKSSIQFQIGEVHVPINVMDENLVRSMHRNLSLRTMPD